MKKIFAIIVLAILLLPTSNLQASNSTDKLAGKILLQVEAKGEAWYVYPGDSRRYYLGRPKDAFDIMKKLGLGAKHDYLARTEIFPERLSGMILLDVETNGEAYYINPENRKMHYLARPSDAFQIMREFGLGITNQDLGKINLGDINTPRDKTSEQNVFLQDAPFTPQAPYGDWTDQRQQDGCEEASALMAMKWVRGEKLDKAGSLETILAISDFELKKYGEYRDINTADVIEWIFNDYFDYEKVALKKTISIDDIISEIKKGNLVITPHNGQLLKNPYFTAPGPIRHMLVIKGYDPSTNEFITNDPGTRNGANYRYNTKTLFDSIRDYPTGYHEKIDKIEKNMIVVWK